MPADRAYARAYKAAVTANSRTKPSAVVRLSFKRRGDLHEKAARALKALGLVSAADVHEEAGFQCFDAIDGGMGAEYRADKLGESAYRQSLSDLKAVRP